MKSKLEILLFVILIWFVTSILKIPAFAGMSFVFAGFFLFYAKEEKPKQLTDKLIMSYFISAVLLGYCLSKAIYPPNVSVIVAGLIGLFVVHSFSLHEYFKNLFTDIVYVYRKDRLATIVFSVVFLTVFVIGSYFSVRIGLTWDENIEQQTFLKGLDAIGKGLAGSTGYYDINSWGDRYYGIGFYFPFYLLHRPFVGLISSGYGVSADTAILLSRHLAVFWLFACSSLIVSRIVYLLTGSLRYAFLVGIAYLLCPYFLGHGMTNVKDSPFACAWLLSSYFLLNLFKNYLVNGAVSRQALIGLAMSIAWLVTIRVSGILFVVPLFVAALMIAEGFACVNVKSLVKSFLSGAVVPLFLVVIFVSLLYPVTWQDPSELFKAVRYMGRHPWDNCTLTFGECMRGQNLPDTYIPAWMIVKLPLFALLGLLALPIACYREYVKGHFHSLKMVGILFASAVLILVLLVLRNTVLYDELRQVLFIVTTLFIVGSVLLFYFNRIFAVVLISASIAIFVSDNIRLFPYQLSWFNEASRFFNLNGKYETDYWGSGLAQLAKYINQNPNQNPNQNHNQNPNDFRHSQCVYADPHHLVSPFLNRESYPCIKSFNELSSNAARPFIYAKYARSSFNPPQGCRVLFVKTTTLTFSKHPLVVGEIGICE